jgi:hypothetical protein
LPPIIVATVGMAIKATRVRANSTGISPCKVAWNNGTVIQGIIPKYTNIKNIKFHSQKMASKVAFQKNFIA